MAKLQYNRETPFKLEISFHRYLQFLEHVRDNDDLDYRVKYAKALLDQSENLHELREGTDNISLLEVHQDILKPLLSDLFPTALSDNEIKAVTVPFSNFTFNFTNRFKKILEDAGQNFELSLRNISDDEFYIFNCCVILQDYFEKNVRLTIPFYYDIPDKNGILKHYRVTINADFTEIFPTESAIILSDEEISELLSNFDDIHLWKRKFPPQSWLLKGFSILSLTDATSEVALSDIKSTLLRLNPENIEAEENLVNYFKSYFDVGDLKLGIMMFNDKNLQLERVPFYQDYFSHDILNFWDKFAEEKVIRETFLNNVRFNPAPIVINDTENLRKELGDHPSYANLIRHNIKSAMLVPVVSNSELLAVMELTSSQPNALNGLKLKKLEVLSPFMINTILRFRNERRNKIEAIIQREYTTLHPSVAWKFEEQAERSFTASLIGETYTLKEISFKNLVPLFGQTDIKSSSQKRNECLKADLLDQISAIENILVQKNITEKEKYLFALQEFKSEIDTLKADTESRFQRFTVLEINPLLAKLENDPLIHNYFGKLNQKNQLFYDNQGKLDESISLVNRKIADYLDEKQKKAQQIYPHYFDRFKSDGVEHDLFVGQSITPNIPLTAEVISDLRYWQLKTIAKTEKKYQNLKSFLPYELEVASLILVYNETIDIRFRMDERRFDVDGAFNTKYEIIKKRLEKAYLKNSDERLTVPGKISIVYFTEEDRQIYLNFIEKLQQKKLILDETEEVEIEELPGITGLRALRVSV